MSCKTYFTVIFFVFFLGACSGGETEPKPSSSSSSSGETSSSSSSSSSSGDSSNSSSSSSSSSSGLPSVTLSFVKPEADAIFDEGNAVDIEITTTPADSIEKIELYVDGILVRELDAPPWEWSSTNGDSMLAEIEPGPAVITATATTNSGEKINAAQNISINPASLRVASLTLIDVSEQSSADAQMAVISFDPRDTGTVVDINLDELGNPPLTLRAETEGQVESVRFSLNEVVNQRTDSNPPYVIAPGSSGIPGPWDLEPGSYTVKAVPYSENSGAGDAGPTRTVRFRLLASKVEIKQDSLFLLEKPGENTNEKLTLNIENSGNLGKTFLLSNIPNWLSTEQLSGEIGPEENVSIVFETPNCDGEKSESGEFNIRIGDGSTSSIPVSWVCSSRPLFDFSLDRFYFNQGVPVNDSDSQAEGADVKLVAKREGLARAFVTSSGAEGNPAAPQVKLFYKTESGEEGSFDLEGPNVVRESVNEGRLDRTFNRKLPKDFFTVDTEYYVMVDPENQVAEQNENNNRYPQRGFRKLEIWDVPTLDIMFVPVIIGNNGRNPNLTDQRIAELMRPSEGRLPLENYVYEVRQPFSVASNETSFQQILNQLNDIRLQDRNGKFYHGIAGNRSQGSGNGIGRIGGKVALSVTSGATIAHEFGHNFTLEHTDCGGPSFSERNYPYENARTGSWGFNIFNNQLQAPTLADFMSYCDPEWIGIWNYRKIMNRRGQDNESLQIAEEQFFELPVEHLILSGTVLDDEAEISAIFSVSSWEEEKIFRAGNSYRLELIDQSASIIYQGSFTSSKLDHSAVEQFEIGIPFEKLAKPIRQVKIYRDDVLVLDDSWPNNQNNNLQKPQIVTAIRLDDERVEIRWRADGITTLWARDVKTNNVLTIDKTGEVVVYTQNDRLRLRFQEYLSSHEIDIAVLEQ